MIDIKFLKPLIIIKKPDYGYEYMGLIIYKREEVLMEARRLDKEEAKLLGHNIKCVCVQYGHSLFLDLWICKIRINWLGKNRSSKPINPYDTSKF